MKPQQQSATMSGERAKTLNELEAQFTAISARAQTLVGSGGKELCMKPPSPGSWSVTECLQHLNISADSYFPIWQQVIANAAPRKSEMNAPYQADFWGRLLSWILEPPARIRKKTVLHLEPTERGEIEVVLDEFVERQERIIGTLRRCRGRAIDQVKIASPVDSRIRYSIWSSFLVNAAHERRHLWQAEQALQKLRNGK
ncbi:DinB family protein [Telmatobacter sp. DSM 110680]|uniref:DinB family protein n=1 Tax=Telmatobacter sp. DSM 110680 TaxID=3036704 RepID=A0AAU7DNI9_9BACT